MSDCFSSLRINSSGLLLGLGIICALWVLWKVQRSPKPVDFVDLVLDEQGKASWTRMCAIGVFLFTTWVMAHLELNGKMDATYFGLYVGTFVGGAVAYQYRPPRIGDGTPGPSDVRVQSSGSQPVNVQVGNAPPGGAA